MHKLKGLLGPVAYRVAVYILPTVAATVGAAVLAYDAQLFASFCGAT